MPHLTIAMGLSETNLIPVLVSIKSLLATTRNPHDLAIALFHDGIASPMANMVKHVLSSCGTAFTLIDMPRILSGFAYKDIICDEMLYPLLIPQYFTSRTFVLSLGAGALVRDDITTLLEQFPTEKKLGAVRCLYHAHKQHDAFYGLTREAEQDIGLTHPERYFSRNLLLFNRNAISTMEGQACIQLLDKGWRARDEAILNHLFQHELHLFPQSWNIPMELFTEPEDRFIPSARQAVTEGRKDVKICQFSSSLHPNRIDIGLNQTNNHAQDYKAIARTIMHDMADYAPQALCGPMWDIMSAI